MVRPSKVPTTENGEIGLTPCKCISEIVLPWVKKVADKSNEITAIALLELLLDLAGCIITIDAMVHKTPIATQIYNAKGLRSRTQSKTIPHFMDKLEDWFEQAIAQI